MRGRGTLRCSLHAKLSRHRQRRLIRGALAPDGDASASASSSRAAQHPPCGRLQSADAAPGRGELPRRSKARLELLCWRHDCGHRSIAASEARSMGAQGRRMPRPSHVTSTKKRARCGRAEQPRRAPVPFRNSAARPAATPLHAAAVASRLRQRGRPFRPCGPSLLAAPAGPRRPHGTRLRRRIPRLQPDCTPVMQSCPCLRQRHPPPAARSNKRVSVSVLWRRASGLRQASAWSRGAEAQAQGACT
jgi:hypothetical protein